MPNSDVNLHGSFLNPDRPARRVEEDRFAVAPFIARLVRPLLGVPPDSSLVLGLYGPWGHGKSSALHFLEAALSEPGHARSGEKDRGWTLPLAEVVRFTPWLYNSVETLLPAFFGTLAGVLDDQPGDGGTRSKLRTALKAMGEFVGPAVKVGLALAPVPGADYMKKVLEHLPDLLEGTAKGGAELLDGGEAAFRERRTEAEQALRSLAEEDPSRRIVMLIDDLDRAGPDEVLAMLKLVKLVADLPNVSYVIAMDRERVAAALDRALAPLRGDDFLEKIVQVGVDLPPYTGDRLSTVAVDGAIQIAEQAGLEARSLHVDWRAWEIVRSSSYEAVLRRVLRTPRDVARVLNAYGFAVLTSQTRADLHAVDMFLLCALQTRFADVYARVRASRRFLLHEDWERSAFNSNQTRDDEEKERASRREQLANIVASDEEGRASALAALEGSARSRAGRRVERDRRPVALDVVLELFPYCLGDREPRSAAELRREARICTREHFDSYFRLSPPPGELRREEVDAFFDALLVPGFDQAQASTVARRADALDDSQRRSLRRGLSDRAERMAREEAVLLARSLPVLARRCNDDEPLLGDVVTMLTKAAASKLEFIRAPRDAKRKPKPSEETGVRLLIEVVAGLPPGAASTFADTLSAPREPELYLEYEDARRIAMAGLPRAMEHVELSAAIPDGEPRRDFQDALGFCWRLARRAGATDSNGRFARLESYLTRMVTTTPGRLADVIAFPAAWAGPRNSVPTFENRPRVAVLRLVDQLMDAARVSDLARAAVQSGQVAEMRWPELVEIFAQWPPLTEAERAEAAQGDE